MDISPAAGGLKSYLQRARSLLKDAQAGVNPFAGLTPQVPDGAKLSGSSGPGSEAFAEMERLGMQQLLGLFFFSKKQGQFTVV